MQVRLTLTGQDAAVARKSLEAWLAGHEELRGRVEPVVEVPQPGTMGLAAEMLLVTMEQGGMATAVASVLIAWIRRQSGKVSLSATRTDGTVITVTADHVRGLTPEEIRSMVDQLAVTLDGTGART